MGRCYHIWTYPVPDWEAAQKVPTFDSSEQYEKCLKCKKIFVREQTNDV